LVNACLRIDNGKERGYFFSLSRDELDAQPWSDGTVYLLPASSFKPDEPIRRDGLALWPAQLASTQALAPVAKLAVTVQDFPLLGQVRGHDESYLQATAVENPEGFPWLPRRGHETGLVGDHAHVLLASSCPMC
jgi:hypothetical protein